MTLLIVSMTITMVYLILLWKSWWPTALPHARDEGSLQLPPPAVLSVVTASFLTPVRNVLDVTYEHGGRDLKRAMGYGF